MLKKFTYGILFIFLLTAGGAAAQNLPTVRAEVVPDSIMIGDQFKLSIEVDKDLVQVIDFPRFDNGKIGDGIEVLQESGIDTLKRDGRRVTIRKQYTLTSFDEGFYSLGKFPALYMDKNVVDTLYAPDSLFLMVSTFEIDTTTQTIYDIKQPIHTPVTFGEYGGYLVLAFIVLQVLFAIVYILIRTLKQRKQGEKPAKQRTEPPHVTAIKELEKLNRQKLWQNHRHKLYYTRLTDIIREYIEERYHIGAMEMTSDEITEALKELSIGERSAVQIRRLLSTADYVKFAKYIPSVEDNEMSYNDAYYFVEDTKYIAPQPETNEFKEEGKEKDTK